MSADAATIPQSTDNEAVAVSSTSLIALAHAARGLSLNPKQIRARTSDTMQSRFKGRGMEYDESRPYQPGDDVRHLDWRVTARSNATYTKTFQEERERPVFLWVDNRGPMFFATRGKFKSVVAAEIAALLGWSATHRGDRVGGAVFFGEEHHEVKPMRGRRGILRLLHYLSQPPLDGISDTALGIPLNRMSRIARPGSLVILISDFRQCDERAQTNLRRLAAHSELVMLQVYDTLEQELPPPGDYRVSDGRNEVRFASRDSALRKTYRDAFAQRTQLTMSLAKKLRSAYLRCRTSDNPLTVLKGTFGARSR